MSHSNNDWVPTVHGGERHRATEALAELASILPPWMSHGICSQSDPEAWFPASGESPAPAKRICAECPVRNPCLDYALEHNETTGVWGGLSGRERRRLLQKGA